MFIHCLFLLACQDMTMWCHLLVDLFHATRSDITNYTYKPNRMPILQNSKNVPIVAKSPFSNLFSLPTCPQTFLAWNLITKLRCNGMHLDFKYSYFLFPCLKGSLCQKSGAYVELSCFQNAFFVWFFLWWRAISKSKK